MHPEVQALLANIEHTHYRAYDHNPNGYTWREGDASVSIAKCPEGNWHVYKGSRWHKDKCLRVAYEMVLKAEIDNLKAAAEALEKRYALIQPLSMDEFLDECKAPMNTHVNIEDDGYQTAWYLLPSGQGASACYSKDTLTWGVNLGCAIDGEGATFAEALAEAESKLPKPLTIEQQIEAHFGVKFKGQTCGAYSDFVHNFGYGHHIQVLHTEGHDPPWRVTFLFGTKSAAVQSYNLTDVYEGARDGLREILKAAMERV